MTDNVSSEIKYEECSDCDGTGECIYCEGTGFMDHYCDCEFCMETEEDCDECNGGGRFEVEESEGE
jgi:hypothetical protein